MRSAALELKNHEQPVLPEAANFNKLAQVYRWLEWFTFGPILWRCRCAFLGEMKDRRSALVIGDGDGRFTARLLERNSHVVVEALDASEAMLHQLLLRAAGNIRRVHARLADARCPNLLSRRFDLIATHFFLDCLTTSEVEALALQIRAGLEPDAAWVISEFAVPDNLYGRLVARPLVSALYFAFGLLTGLTIRQLPEHHDALQIAGFVLTRQRKWLGGLLVSEMWQPAPTLKPRRYLAATTIR